MVLDKTYTYHSVEAIFNHRSESGCIQFDSLDNSERVWRQPRHPSENLGLTLKMMSRVFRYIFLVLHQPCACLYACMCKNISMTVVWLKYQWRWQWLPMSPSVTWSVPIVVGFVIAYSFVFTKAVSSTWDESDHLHSLRIVVLGKGTKLNDANDIQKNSSLLKKKSIWICVVFWTGVFLIVIIGN